MTHLHVYTEFQFNMSVCDVGNERKPIHIGIFPSPKGITLSQIIQPDPYSKSTCLFSWHIYMYIPNFNSTCQFVMQIVSRNWKLLEFKYKGYNSAENYSIRTKFELNLCVLVANLCTKFHLKIPTCDRENERKLNPEGRKYGNVTLYASAISWRGHKRVFFYHYIYARR